MYVSATVTQVAVYIMHTNRNIANTCKQVKTHHTHTHVRIDTDTYIYTRTHAPHIRKCTHAYKHINALLYPHKHTQSHAYMHGHTHHTHTYIMSTCRLRTHKCIHTYTHTHVDTHTHTHVDTHTHSHPYTDTCTHNNSRSNWTKWAHNHTQCMHE